ncbi:ester cyclase [Ideonella sp. B7]|uniref:ester cyclase n=1 Tax=Ideonella benzenivorans TaxID=2831643 RepID=UPI001CEC6FFF|nr:ester cyclase [Ideonella benzenivorans]MCA6215691.1 ester cyclase [Ideonella benzenivorans]
MHRSLSPWWLAAWLTVAGSVHAEEALIQARTLVVDPHLDTVQAQGEILAARRYGTFWSTGDAALARAALAPDFMDRTLPPGRAQGLPGPLAASEGFRQAVPDLRCEIEQMIVAGDRVVSHLRFTGHFSGRFQGRQGQGQAVNFIATDIYRVQDGRIAENWHLEDNLTLLQQMGLVAL